MLTQSNNNRADNSYRDGIYPYELCPEKLLTIEDITKVMRVSEGTVRLWMYGEGLPFIKIRGRIWIREVDLAQWLSNYRVIIKSISERVRDTQNEL